MPQRGSSLDFTAFTPSDQHSKGPLSALTFFLQRFTLFSPQIIRLRTCSEAATCSRRRNQSMSDSPSQRRSLLFSFLIVLWPVFQLCTSTLSAQARPNA